MERLTPLALYTPRPHAWTFYPQRHEFRSRYHRARLDLAASEAEWGRDSEAAEAAIDGALTALGAPVNKRDGGDSIGRERREHGIKLATLAGDSDLVGRLARYDRARRSRDGLRTFIKFAGAHFLPAPVIGLTRTGRARMSGPNLQGLSERVGTKQLLTPYLPGRGLVVQLDLSQAEPRVLAAASGCEVLRAALDGDVYADLAARLGVERAVAKQLTIAVCYGMGPQLVSSKLACSFAEAKELQAGLLNAWPGVKAYKERVIAESRSGFVMSASGQRKVAHLLDEDGNSKEYAALNTAIQAGAADLLLDLLGKWVRLRGALPCHTVHDSIVDQGDPAELVANFRALLDAPPSWMRGVPLVGEAKWGRNVACLDGGGVLTTAGFQPNPSKPALPAAA